MLKHKNDIRKFRSSFVKIGIRRAKYRELWNVVKKLMAVKSVNESIISQSAESSSAEDDGNDAAVIDVDEENEENVGEGEDYQVLDVKNEKEKSEEATKFKIDGAKLNNLVEQTLGAINKNDKGKEESKEKNEPK